MQLVIYLLCLPALLIIVVTALVRANDISWTNHTDWHWHVRRVAMFVIGGAGVAFLLSPFWFWKTAIAYHLCGGAMLWGFACAWLTTPNMPPWWKYITKGQTTPQPGKDNPAQMRMFT